MTPLVALSQRWKPPPMSWKAAVSQSACPTHSVTPELRLRFSCPDWNQSRSGHWYVVPEARTPSRQPAFTVGLIQTRQSPSLFRLEYTTATTAGGEAAQAIISRIHWSL